MRFVFGYVRSVVAFEALEWEHKEYYCIWLICFEVLEWNHKKYCEMEDLLGDFVFPFLIDHYFLRALKHRETNNLNIFANRRDMGQGSATTMEIDL